MLYLTLERAAEYGEVARKTHEVFSDYTARTGIRPSAAVVAQYGNRSAPYGEESSDTKPALDVTHLSKGDVCVRLGIGKKLKFAPIIYTESFVADLSAYLRAHENKHSSTLALPLSAKVGFSEDKYFWDFGAKSPQTSNLVGVDLSASRSTKEALARFKELFGEDKYLKFAADFGSGVLRLSGKYQNPAQVPVDRVQAMQKFLNDLEYRITKADLKA